MKETLDNLDGIGYFKDNDFALVYDHEAFNEVVHQEELKEVTKELEKEKKEILLKHQTEINSMVKSMLKNNVDIELVSKIINISIKDLEKLKNELMTNFYN